jgi:hypothetical protein
MVDSIDLPPPELYRHVEVRKCFCSFTFPHFLLNIKMCSSPA